MEPNVTDWISAIAALLGIPALLFGIGRLFVKDKDKERKLNALDSLANSQALQIDELSKQTSEYKYHSMLMKESNNLFSEQIQLQNRIFLHGKVTEEQKTEVADKIRRSDIKPYFSHIGTIIKSNEFIIKLKNLGECAKKVTLKKEDSHEYQLNPIMENKEFRSKDILSINGKLTNISSSLYLKDLNIQFTVIFKDIEENEYEQQISLNKGATNISNPSILKS
jgi:hypothetical protein